MKLRNVTLELSAKPFQNDSEEMMYSVGRTLFRQWAPLTAEADTVSVLLWLADGSEILEYSGDPNQTFEWGYWQGIANPLPPPKNPTAWDKKYLNYYPVKYRPDAAPRTYAWLKRMIEVLRETDPDRRNLRQWPGVLRLRLQVPPPSGDRPGALHLSAQFRHLQFRPACRLPRLCRFSLGNSGGNHPRRISRPPVP